MRTMVVTMVVMRRVERRMVPRKTVAKSIGMTKMMTKRTVNGMTVKTVMAKQVVADMLAKNPCPMDSVVLKHPVRDRYKRQV